MNIARAFSQVLSNENLRRGIAENLARAAPALVDPRCQGVIKSLERTIWTDRNPDLATIDKSEGVEHYSDGIRYGFEYLYPVNQTGSRTARGFSF